MIFDLSTEISSEREIDIKNPTYYYLNDMISIKSIDTSKTKIYETLYK